MAIVARRATIVVEPMQRQTSRRTRWPGRAACAGVALLVVAALAAAAPSIPTRDGDRKPRTSLSAVAVPAIAPLARLPAAERPGAAPLIDASSSPTALARAVAAHAQDLWARAFAQAGLRYRSAELVVLRGTRRPACRSKGLGVGPYYCPGDETLYVDAAYLRRLRRTLGPSSTVAQAYVIAHEIGHHVQELDGVRAGVERAARRAPQSADWLHGREELQADCLAGVWVSWAYRHAPLSAAERDTALAAAQGIGDDKLRPSGAWPEPDGWTHGSGTERRRWLAVGMRTGDPRRCDPFR